MSHELPIIEKKTFHHAKAKSLQYINEPGPQIFVITAYAQCHSLNIHAQLSIGTKDNKLGLRVHLRSCLVYASSEGSGETAQLRRLA